MYKLMYHPALRKGLFQGSTVFWGGSASRGEAAKPTPGTWEQNKQHFHRFFIDFYMAVILRDCFRTGTAKCSDLDPQRFDSSFICGPHPLHS